MANPQQPELRRSGHTPVDQGHAEEIADSGRGTRAGRRSGRDAAQVPPENEPGHHPPVEQDKPVTPPPTPTGARKDRAAAPGRDRFAFAFARRLMPVSAAFGVIPPTAHVDVDETELRIRFGPWSLRTPLHNVRSLTPTGPYSWWKIAGPAHISVADRGITFATTTERGVCIRFHEPVEAALPTSLLRHPAATVTVEDPDALIAAISARTELED